MSPRIQFRLADGRATTRVPCASGGGGGSPPPPARHNVTSREGRHRGRFQGRSRSHDARVKRHASGTLPSLRLCTPAHLADDGHILLEEVAAPLEGSVARRVAARLVRRERVQPIGARADVADGLAGRPGDLATASRRVLGQGQRRASVSSCFTRLEPGRGRVRLAREATPARASFAAFLVLAAGADGAAGGVGASSD